MTKIKDKDLEKIYGGGWFAVAFAALPSIISMLTQVTGLAKSATSSSGSIKSGGNDYKWESKESGGKSITEKHIEYYVY